MRDILDEGEEFFDLDGVGGNRQFAPLAPIGIEGLRELSIIESQHLHDIQEGHRTINDILEAEEELWNNDLVEPYMILDVGLRTIVWRYSNSGQNHFHHAMGGAFPMIIDILNHTLW